MLKYIHHHHHQNPFAKVNHLFDFEYSISFFFVVGAPSSPPPKQQQQQFDPQSKETDHDKASLVVRSTSDA